MIGVLITALLTLAQIGPLPGFGPFLSQHSCDISPLTATQFYVSSTTGNDNSCGTTPSSAWQTIAKINAHTFLNNTTISFKGGDTFPGGIVLTTSVIASAPTINSYGVGQAIISPGNISDCVKATSVPSVTVTNINCAGGGIATSNFNGIQIENNLLPNGTMIAGPTITNNTVTGFGYNCIHVIALNGADGFGDSGFIGVTVSNNLVHDCDGNDTNGGGAPKAGSACLYMSGGNGNLLDPHVADSIQNVTVSGNTFYNCTGTVGQVHTTGDGLLLFGVTTFSVDHNIIHDTGTLGDLGAGGPVGLLVYFCDSGVVSFNETYDTHTDSFTDGQNMNISGCHDVIAEYNYMHGHSGGGGGGQSYLLIDTDGSRTLNNVDVRFNIIDMTVAAGPALDVSTTNADLTNLRVYNNTFVGTGNMFAGGCDIGGHNFTINVSNNIFAAINFNAVNLTTVGCAGSITMTGNDYFFSGGNPFAVTLNGVAYPNLAAMQAAGFEMVAGNPVGTTLNPNLTGGATPTCGGYVPPCPGPELLTNAAPAGKGNGLNLNAIYGFNVGTQDFYGNVVGNLTLPIGAAGNL